jgi:hypothetical protein
MVSKTIIRPRHGVELEYLIKNSLPADEYYIKEIERIKSLLAH